jgi:hypothetical protein
MRLANQEPSTRGSLQLFQRQVFVLVGRFSFVQSRLYLNSTHLLSKSPLLGRLLAAADVADATAVGVPQVLGLEFYETHDPGQEGLARVLEKHHVTDPRHDIFGIAVLRLPHDFLNECAPAADQLGIHGFLKLNSEHVAEIQMHFLRGREKAVEQDYIGLAAIFPRCTFLKIGHGTDKGLIAEVILVEIADRYVFGVGISVSHIEQFYIRAGAQVIVIVVCEQFVLEDLARWPAEYESHRPYGKRKALRERIGRRDDTLRFEDCEQTLYHEVVIGSALVCAVEAPERIRHAPKLYHTFRRLGQFHRPASGVSEPGII